MRGNTLLSLTTAAAVLSQGALAQPTGCKAAAKNAKAIYVLGNDAKNAVVAVALDAKGMLSDKGSVTATGGAGSNGIDGSNMKAAVPDALFSQSALTVAGNNLFAVNAGSNTLTMFAIDPADATKLTMLGQPVAIPGEFPVSVAASTKNNMACVATTGAKAGVACSSFSAQGLGAMDGLRAFDLKQTTPPVGPTNTVSQVFFSDDGKTLFTTVKGDPTKNNTGFLASFGVSSCGNAKAVSEAAIMSSPAGTAVLFGSSTIPGSKDLFVTDASFGGAVLSMDAAGAATVKGKAAIDGQKATCWATVSPATNTAFVTDVASNRIVEMSTKDASIQNVIDLSANGDPGLIDLKAAGNLVYALSPGNGTTPASVTVLDAVTKKQVQHVSLEKMSLNKNAMGMAVVL